MTQLTHPPYRSVGPEPCSAHKVDLGGLHGQHGNAKET
jgi:hypothetical protein